MHFGYSNRDLVWEKHTSYESELLFLLFPFKMEIWKSPNSPITCTMVGLHVIIITVF